MLVCAGMNQYKLFAINVAAATLLVASTASAQPTGPLVPALTPEQIARSQELAAKYDQNAARERSASRRSRTARSARSFRKRST